MRVKIANGIGPHIREWVLDNYKGRLSAEASSAAVTDAIVDMVQAGTLKLSHLRLLAEKDKGLAGDGTAAAEDEEMQEIERRVEATVKQYVLDNLSHILRPAQGSDLMTKRDRKSVG